MKHKKIKYTIIILSSWVLINQGWILVNNKFLYIHDEDIRDYFFKYRNNFETIVMERQKNCGKYFQKKAWRQGGWYYKDFFGENSQQAKDFLAKHPLISKIRSSITVHADRRTKSPQGFTYYQSLNACRRYPYMSFHLKKFSYKTRKNLFFQNSYEVNKVIMYLSHPENMMVHDWNLFEKNPEFFNRYFNQFSSKERMEFERSGKDYPWDDFLRPSSISSEHGVLNCEYSYRSFTPGFTKLSDNWYIYAAVHNSYYGRECINPSSNNF